MNNCINSHSINYPLQNFMNNLQQTDMKLHEVCNNFNLGLAKLKDVAKEINVPESTIRTWIRRGDIPKDVIKKIGSTIFIREERFNEWVEKGD